MENSASIINENFFVLICRKEDSLSRVARLKDA